MNINKILVFAGTSDGKQLIEKLIRNFNDIEIHCSVATSYGEDILKREIKNCKILQGRLDKKEIVNLINKEKYNLVVDATHPFAYEVTNNIRKAVEETKSDYMRLLRDENIYDDSFILVNSFDEAVTYLNSNNEKAFLTIGSKELAQFTKVKDFENRIFARVLPMQGVVDECLNMGYHGRNLICMQGPFSTELNTALIKHANADVMITKDSGNEGGLNDKTEAAKNLGIKVLVIKRPEKETGYSAKEIIDFIADKKGITNVNICHDKSISKINDISDNSCDKTILKSKKQWMPIFIDTKDKTVLVVGAGNIAERRIKTLLDFEFNIKVVAPKIKKEIKILENKDNICILEKEFEKKDIIGVDYVMAATDNSELNKKIKEIASNKNIMTNIISEKELCDFFFPGIAIKDDITIGITCQGKNHKMAKKVTDEIKLMLKNKEF